MEQPARLRSVTVLSASLTLPWEGSEELSFQVREPGFSFNYSVGDPLCQVRLQLRDGSAPSVFRLAGIVKGET